MNDTIDTPAPPYTISQVQERFGGICRATVYRYQERGIIKGYRLGGRRVFARDHIDTLVREGFTLDEAAA